MFNVWINKLLDSKGNCKEATTFLLKFLKVQVTESGVSKSLEEHPDFPSLLAVSDTLQFYGVDSAAIKIDKAEFIKLIPPVLVQMEFEGKKYFSVIVDKTSENLLYLDPLTSRLKRISNNQFEDIFSGYALIPEIVNEVSEVDYEIKINGERFKKIVNIFSLLCVPFFTIVYLGISIYTYGNSLIYPSLFTFFTLVGLLVSVILVWFEIDKNNAALKQICTSKKNTNCNAVLTSDYAKVFGVSWSTIGLVYFLGAFLTMITNGILIPTTSLFSLFSIIVSPYIFYSIYYQAKVIKQWCTFCLIIQGVLFLQLITVIQGGLFDFAKIQQLRLLDVLPVLFCYMFSVVLVSIVIPNAQRAKESLGFKTRLQKLKHDKYVFDTLLSKQKKVIDPGEMGIKIGNPNAPVKIIKVCNPYCGPCAKSHPIIENLLAATDNIQVQIIFTATAQSDDYRNAITKHLITLAAKESSEGVKKVLDDWYLAPEKIYKEFAQKYPISEDELQLHESSLTEMNEWCEKSKIEYTPTFFINGYQLPRIYSIDELKYFYTV
ncbi:MAG: thioredoxin domain-containing protein [Chitinophagaceae bacterium]|nr:thioredoxin domain-containing protein [Chitinophagaceae bacterium]